MCGTSMWSSAGAQPPLRRPRQPKILTLRRGRRPRPPYQASHLAHVDFPASKEGGRGRPPLHMHAELASSSWLTAQGSVTLARDPDLLCRPAARPFQRHVGITGCRVRARPQDPRETEFLHRLRQVVLKSAGQRFRRGSRLLPSPIVMHGDRDAPRPRVESKVQGSRSLAARHMPVSDVWNGPEGCPRSDG
jgi:hypothetical protein